MEQSQTSYGVTCFHFRLPQFIINHWLRMSNIKVFCRFRPLNQLEPVNYKIEDSTVKIGDLKFTYDRVFDSPTTQEEIYEHVGHPIIDHILQGFNATLLMYGQTSSGKTHTMIGDQAKPGILRRTIGDLFAAIAQTQDEAEYRIKISIFEIYKEKIRDLLDTAKQDLKVRELANKGFFVESVTQMWISEEHEIHAALQKSLVNRQVGHTNLNDMSSRSHLMFQLTLILVNTTEETQYTGQLIMADLAGSENATRAGTEGKQLQEGAFINKSLLTLSNVINALAEKASHTPYRESNLTKLLWNGLSKNSRTSLVITCSPAQTNESETVSTLRFGVRAKTIKTQPKVNKEITVRELEIQNQKLTKELEEKQFLIDQMKQDMAKEKIFAVEELNLKLITQNESLKGNLLQTQQDLEQLSEDFHDLQQLYQQQCLEKDSLQKRAAELEGQLQIAQEENELEIGQLQSTIMQLKQELLGQQRLNERQGEDLRLSRQKELELSQQLLPANDISLIDLKTTSPNKLLEEIDQLKAMVANEKLKLKQQQSVYQSQLDVTQRESQLLEKDIAAIMKENKSLKDQMKELESLTSKLKKDLEDRIKKVVDLEELNDNLQEQVHSLSRLMQGNVFAIYDENERLKLQLEEVNRQYASNIFNNSSFQSQSMVLQQKLQQKNGRITALEQENLRLKQTLNQSQTLQEQNQQSEIIFQSYQGQPATRSSLCKVVKKPQFDLL